jgi:predicted Fe-S protein YdhL (DUF1289 family)
MTENVAAIESPCIRECVIEQATGYCRGCYRTLDEISYWMRYTPDERQRVMQSLSRRRAVVDHNTTRTR